jgi:hypothetical protein
MAVRIHIVVFWIITWYCLVVGYQHVEGNICQITTQHYNLEDHNIFHCSLQWLVLFISRADIHDL